MDEILALKEFVKSVDKSIRPEIYKTNNAEYYEQYAVDFFPETCPTLVPFNNLQEVETYLVELFGKEQWDTWFPNGVQDKSIS